METTKTDIEITTSSPENPSNAANSAAPTETVINTVTTIVIPKESITELKTTTNNDNVDAPMKISTATITTSPIPSSSNGENIIVTELPQKQDKMDQQGDLINFKVLYVLTQLCGLTLIVLMGTWVGVYMGGTAWTSDPAHEFNWHPLFMTIGLIYLYGNGILVYRGFRNFRKKGLKLAHAGIHMSAFILTVIALVAAFDSHNLRDPPIPNMYTLHSWLGISAVGLFSLQYVLGFVMFLFPMAREQLRAQFMPLHIYFGLFGFVLAIASALMGLTEKAIFSIPNYALLPPSGVMVNIMGVLFVIFGGLVVYLTTEREYKRKPLPEDTKLLTGASE